MEKVLAIEHLYSLLVLIVLEADAAAVFAVLLYAF
jgi:hypothetical protein